MIASLIVTLNNVTDLETDILHNVAAIPGVEIGDVQHTTRRVPITIDALNPKALEETTQRLQQCPGVAFVDVVFVHFEDDAEVNFDSSDATHLKNTDNL